MRAKPGSIAEQRAFFSNPPRGRVAVMERWQTSQAADGGACGTPPAPPPSASRTVPLPIRPRLTGRICILAAATVSTLSVPASAAGLTDLSAIDRAVADFTGAAIGTPGGARLPVDRRLRLAECVSGIALERYGRARNTVIVQCPEPGGWRVFVPLVDGGGTSSSAVAAGLDVVSRGSRVTISVKGSGFTLSRQGQALEAGAVSEWIRVQPIDRKGDPLRAQVLRPGVVGMELP